MKKLGFINVKKEPEIIEDPEFCKNLFKKYGACVDMKELEEMLKKKDESVESKFSGENNIEEEMELVLDSIEEALDDQTEDDTEKEKINKIKEKMKDGSNKCKKAMKKI